jgi:hypothetical protein
MKENFEFMERINRDIEARKAACRILAVEENAYRQAAMKHHPDHNQDDPDANKKFALVKCAYELLAEDKSCPDLLEEINSWEGVTENGKYKLDNPWGHFLWWREKFFGSEKKKGPNGKRSSCI